MTTIISTCRNFIDSLLTHLWLSVSSVRFYQMVFLQYSGYGLRYIATLSAIVALICTMLFLNYTNIVINYLRDGVITPQTKLIDDILEQLPSFAYNGTSISYDQKQMQLIQANGGKTTIAIDLKNEIPSKERIKTLVILSEDTIIINLLGTSEHSYNSLVIRYNQLFDPTISVITKEVVKQTFLRILTHATRLMVYLFFPLVILLILINTLLEKAMMVCIIFVLNKWYKHNIPFKNVLRVVLFSSGLQPLFQLTAFVNITYFTGMIFLLQAWAHILMITAIVKLPHVDVDQDMPRAK